MLPETLAEELRYIEIYTAKAARDHRVGDYKSKLRGPGFAFDQHKPYQIGDDYRRIDWNVTARLRQLFVKKELEDKEMTALIVADLSRSMAFGSTAVAKKQLLLQAAATLAFSAFRDNIAVGLIGFTDAIELDVPARKGRAHLWHLLETLWDHAPASARTDFSVPLQQLRRRLKRSALIFLLSDFIGDADTLQSQTVKSLAQRHDLIPLILEDAWEEALPAGEGSLRMQDPETGGALLIDLAPARAAQVTRLMQERKLALKRAFYRLHLDHVFLRPDEPYLDVLLGLFLARKRHHK